MPQPTWRPWLTHTTALADLSPPTSTPIQIGSPVSELRGTHALLPRPRRQPVALPGRPLIAVVSAVREIGYGVALLGEARLRHPRRGVRLLDDLRVVDVG